jgi:hypothetical protein
VINLQDNDGVRLTIAGIALVILAASIAFSKRKTTTLDEPTPAAARTEVPAA